MAVTRAPSVDLLRILRCSYTTIPKTSSRTIRPIYHTSIRRRSITTSKVRKAENNNISSQTHSHQGGQSPSPTTSSDRRNPYAPTTRDRGPESKEDTQTDFGALDIYSNTPEPATGIDACTPSGFHLNNGTKITGGSGVLLVGGEAFTWKPWIATLNSSSSNNTNNTKSSDASPPPKREPKITDLLDPKRPGLLVIPAQSLSILKYLHPKPDLLLVGTGSKTLMLHPESRKYIVDELGMRLDVMDTANASAAYNLLATERGVDGGSGVGAAMLPVGWKGIVPVPSSGAEHARSSKYTRSRTG